MSTISQAFAAIDRKDFLPKDDVDLASYDMPIPIGYGQTNSQPSTVRLMLEWLDPRSGDKVLDIGSGSGWTSALLAVIVGQKGRVFSVERIPELLKFGEKNCQKYDLKNVEFNVAESVLGLPARAPYDRILVSATASELPSELLVQLKNNGKLVVPVKEDIIEITKIDDDTFNTVVHPGFVFVPLV